MEDVSNSIWRKNGNGKGVPERVSEQVSMAFRTPTEAFTIPSNRPYQEEEDYACIFGCKKERRVANPNSNSAADLIAFRFPKVVRNLKGCEIRESRK
jgi:hypothetical protein